MFYDRDSQFYGIPVAIQRQLPKISTCIRMESVSDLLHYFIIDHYYDHQLVSYEYIKASSIPWC